MHEKFKWILLPELVFFQEGPGVRNHQYTSTGIKLLNVANLQGGMLYLDNTERYISEDEAYGKYKHFLVDEGDLIIASSGIKVEYFDQKMGFAKKEHLPLCMNTSTIRFKTLDSNILNIRYFMYFLKSIFFKKQLARLITGSAQLNFGPSHLKQIKVLLPSIDYQNKIVNILDQAQELIDKRKAQIEALDELIQSVFYEMFGDPVQNPFSFDQYKIKDLVIDDKYAIKAGPFGSALKKEYYVESGYKVYGQEQVIQGDLAYGDYYIDEDRYRMLENCKIQSGDLLISLVGTFGKMLVVPDNFQEGIINPRLMKISFDQSKILPQFFKSMFQNEAMIKYMNRNTHGATMGILNTTIIKELNVIVPSLEMQLDYLNRRMFIEKQKELLNESLVELENNFNSLMQRAFNGEPLC